MLVAFGVLVDTGVVCFGVLVGGFGVLVPTIGAVGVLTTNGVFVGEANSFGVKVAVGLLTGRVRVGEGMKTTAVKVVVGVVAGPVGVVTAPNVGLGVTLLTGRVRVGVGKITIAVCVDVGVPPAIVGVPPALVIVGVAVPLTTGRVRVGVGPPGVFVGEATGLPGVNVCVGPGFMEVRVGRGVSVGSGVLVPGIVRVGADQTPAGVRAVTNNAKKRARRKRGRPPRRLLRWRQDRIMRCLTMPLVPTYFQAEKADSIALVARRRRRAPTTVEPSLFATSGWRLPEGTNGV